MSSVFCGYSIHRVYSSENYADSHADTDALFGIADFGVDADTLKEGFGWSSGAVHVRQLITESGKTAGGASGDEKGEKEERKAERVDTPFGLTDDIVHLKNGKTYFFFKLPHKVLVLYLYMYRIVYG